VFHSIQDWLQDMDVRRRKKQLELLWRGSESLGDTAELFTGNFASGNYGPPPGFNWDWGQADPQMQVLCRVSSLRRSCACFKQHGQLQDTCIPCCAMWPVRCVELPTTPGVARHVQFCGVSVQDDPRLVDYNVPERLEAFVSECNKLFNVTRGNDIMLTMGTDFTVRVMVVCLMAV